MTVAFIDQVHHILNQRLTEAGFICEDATELNENDCKKLIETAEGIIIRSRFKMDSHFLANAAQLKFIARSGAGMENIDEHFCAEKGIHLFNAPEGNRDAVGEHALGMLLTLLNRLHISDREVRQGLWNREANRGVELGGKTVGIIGYGNTGNAFARKLSGLDVKVLAYDKNKTGFSEGSIEEASMEQLFHEADVVSLHIPQNLETTYLADELFFSSFKKPIYFLNLSRGKILKTAALVKAIKNKQVLGACLDVNEYEKSSFETFDVNEANADFKYLLKSEKLLFSPHVAGWTEESYFKLSDALADKILLNFSVRSE